MHLIVIAGPTATGKTAMAAELAHRLETELISADSRQVYRGLDLGTGKDLEEYRKFTPAVKYHLIDIVEPEAGFSLYQYQQACYQVLAAKSGNAGSSGAAENAPMAAEVRRSGKNGGRHGNPDVMVMAGGTGLYIEAVLRRYRIANVPEDADLRARLTGRAREDLEAELRAKDPSLAARADLSSAKRIIRALEVWHAAHAGTIEHSPPPPVDFTFSVFGTRLDRTGLRARIDARLEARLQAGMVEEVESLLARGVTRERMQVLGMEYREISDHLAGLKNRDQMVADLRHEIHMLAKRQETWFRGMERRGVPVRWLEPGQDAAAIQVIWEQERGENG
ncbi:MAG: tRNA (adenosine(37)-N6)-dimethylallyltransferase MiaA [Fibrobacteria bacterium]